MPSQSVIDLVGHTQTFQRLVLSGDEDGAQTFAVETIGPALDVLYAPGGFQCDEDGEVACKVLGAVLQILIGLSPRPVKARTITKLIKSLVGTRKTT